MKKSDTAQASLPLANGGNAAQENALITQVRKIQAREQERRRPRKQAAAPPPEAEPPAPARQPSVRQVSAPATARRRREAPSPEESDEMDIGQSEADSPQMLLPFWPERSRGLPNALARSALFTAKNRASQRKDLKNKAIACVKGFTITYRGEELRQHDEDVFLQMLHIARHSPLGDCVEFTAHSFLQALDWGRSKDAYERLRECLERLSATTITISFESGKKGYSGSLVRKFTWKEDDDRQLRMWRVWLESEIRSLFDLDMYTQVTWEQRKGLPPLAKWLHQFYHTHAEPLPYKVATLKTLSGVETKQLYHFREKLKQALNKLKDPKCGFLEDWWIRNDNVHVVRKPMVRDIRVMGDGSLLIDQQVGTEPES